VNGFSWTGDYDSWQQAQKASTGYNSQIILDKVKDALLKVKNGQAAGERDSVLLKNVEYSWPILSALMWIAAQSKGRLNLIDFGGSLGSSYFQNRAFLKHLSEVHWNIVEQKHFVDTGKRYFEDDSLKFFYDMQSCLEQYSPNTILFSSVLQYLEKPYELLEEVKALNFKFILVDRTPFTIGQKDKLTVQTVPHKVYSASYPCWFFDKARVTAFFEDRYITIAGFKSIDKANIPSSFEGFILKKK